MSLGVDHPASLNRSTVGQFVAVVLLASLFLAGCSREQKSYVVLLSNPDGSTGEVVVTGTKGEQVLWKPGQGTPTDGANIPTAMAEERIKKDFGDAIAAQPKLPVRVLLYFGEGSKLTKQSEALLPKIVAEAATRPGLDLSVIGHTDTLNTESYNEQLALKRAAAVALMLKERGLTANSVTVESHGKRNLLVPTPDNTFEPKNRRVEVSIR